MEKKITKKEIFAEIITVLEGGEFSDKFSLKEAVAFCNKEIDALSRKADKAKEAAAKKKSEVDTLAEQIEGVLTDEFATIGEITKLVIEYDPDASNAKVSYRLNKLVELGKAIKEQITIPATETAKARKCQAYKKA